jgi:hypothetical protein
MVTTVFVLDADSVQIFGLVCHKASVLLCQTRVMTWTRVCRRQVEYLQERYHSEDLRTNEKIIF